MRETATEVPGHARVFVNSCKDLGELIRTKQVLNTQNNVLGMRP